MLFAVTTSGNAVRFSTGNPDFRATSLYVYNLTAGNSLLLDVTSTAGTTGFTVPSTTLDLVPEARRVTGFSAIASTAAGSASLSYLASASSSSSRASRSRRRRAPADQFWEVSYQGASLAAPVAGAGRRKRTTYATSHDSLIKDPQYQAALVARLKAGTARPRPS